MTSEKSDSSMQLLCGILMGAFLFLMVVAQLPGMFLHLILFGADTEATEYIEISDEVIFSGDGEYLWPLPANYGSNSITSRFGKRKSPGGIGSTNHKGLDIGAATGVPVYAAKDGVITYSGWSMGYGNLVKIKHNDGTITEYAHMSARKVSNGQTVQQGAVIGLVGSTGNSTGPHLHFAVEIGGKPIDPLKLYI